VVSSVISSNKVTTSLKMVLRVSELLGAGVLLGVVIEPPEY
jgi:hypothetical protein